MQTISEEKYHCPNCAPLKFTMCKTWERGKWVYFCFSPGCNYRREYEPSKDEISMFNEGVDN